MRRSILAVILLTLYGLLVPEAVGMLVVGACILYLPYRILSLEHRLLYMGLGATHDLTIQKKDGLRLLYWVEQTVTGYRI